MPDFSKLLTKKVDDAKKPPVLPAGDYPGIIKAWAVGDNNQKNTPYARFTLGFTGWPDEIDEDDKEGIDLSTRQRTTDFYLTDEADWRLTEFIKSCGIDTTDRDFGETLPETIGARIIIPITQKLNQKSNEVYNEVGKIVGEG